LSNCFAALIWLTFVADFNLLSFQT